MRRALLIVSSVVLICLAASSVVADEDQPVFGTVKTTKRTPIKIAPSAPAAAARMLDANTELRWVRGDRRGNYVRVMVPKGPLGWVLETDVQKVSEPDLSSIALESSAQPCVSPPTLNACTANKPAGCSAIGSAHGSVNELKRKIPSSGPAITVTFETFSQLQAAAGELVDAGVDILPKEIRSKTSWKRPRVWWEKDRACV